MESTGIYWRPVYNILEGYFDITLANAMRIKNVPGRKTDVSDAEWIAKLLRVGLIEKSFVPSSDLRELRELTRLRKKRIGNLTAEKNRIQKMLEASNIKLGTVISDVFGVSGRKLLERLVEQGYIDVDDIEQRVHRSVKHKVPRLAESLFGTLTSHQILLIRNCWKQITNLEESIAELDVEITAHLQPYKEEYELIQTIPGVSGNAQRRRVKLVQITLLNLLSTRNYKKQKKPQNYAYIDWLYAFPRWVFLVPNEAVTEPITTVHFLDRVPTEQLEINVIID